MIEYVQLAIPFIDAYAYTYMYAYIYIHIYPTTWLFHSPHGKRISCYSSEIG